MKADEPQYITNEEQPLLPEATTDFYGALRAAGYPKSDLIKDIVSMENMSQSFDYVVAHLENAHQRERIRPHKDEIIQMLTEQISNGTFRIYLSECKEIDVHEGGKWRKCQAPPIVKRIGCHSIMVIVERLVKPTLITNCAASIKGRGMHWLFHRMEADINAYDERCCIHYFQSDYEKCYDNIDQTRMKAELRYYISDPVLLLILDNFVELLEKGLSKGLRSSQCYANMYMSPIHHVLLAYLDEHTHFYAYMDDYEIIRADTDEKRNKRMLWKYREILHRLSAERGLTIKPSEAIRPLECGLDALGYVNFGTHALIRKRTKQKAARKLAKVKSRKRRQEIIGSFKGMACHADCKHLFFVLTNQKMKKFSEMGVSYTPADGKKRFPGRVLSLGSILNTPIEVHDYEVDVSTKHGAGRYVVSCKRKDCDEWFKFFTASEEMKSILDQIGEMDGGFPFETIITVEYFDGGKRMYKFT